MNLSIDSVTVRYVERPRPVPVANGSYVYASNQYVFIELTAGAHTGVGWAVGNEIVAAAARHMAPVVLGLDPLRPQSVWDRLWQPKVYGRRGLVTRAMSALDIAVWDLRGKALGLSVGQLIGGYAASAPVYCAGGYYGEDDDDVAGLVAEMESFVERGARAVKMKIGRLSLAQDLRRVAAVRTAIGAGIDLLVDANNAYDVADAVRIGRAMEQHDVYWFEEPVAPDDYRGSAQVARALDVPVAAGENEYTRWGFRDLLEAGAADVLNADAQCLGGITEWLKVADAAQAYGVTMAPHGHHQIHLHLVAGVSNGLIVEGCTESNSPLLMELFPEGFGIREDGTMAVPDGPGLGAEPAAEAMEKYTKSTFTTGAE